MLQIELSRHHYFSLQIWFGWCTSDLSGSVAHNAFPQHPPWISALCTAFVPPKTWFGARCSRLLDVDSSTDTRFAVYLEELRRRITLRLIELVRARWLFTSPVTADSVGFEHFYVFDSSRKSRSIMWMFLCGAGPSISLWLYDSFRNSLTWSAKYWFVLLGEYLLYFQLFLSHFHESGPISTLYPAFFYSIPLWNSPKFAKM